MNLLKHISLLLLITAFIAGCAPGQPITPDPTVSHADQVGGYTDLVDALAKLGATISSEGELSQPFFSVPGKVIKVNGADVQTYEYPSESARKAESSQITPQGSFPTTMVTWIDQPNFWAKGRMIVLYVGQDAEVKALLSQVMGDPIVEGDIPAVVPPL